jgi:hypothetical protein
MLSAAQPAYGGGGAVSTWSEETAAAVSAQRPAACDNNPGRRSGSCRRAAAGLVLLLLCGGGACAAAGRALTPVVWDYGRGPIRLHPFVCRIVAGELHPHEHSEIRWCLSDELTALDWAEADVPILAEWLNLES